MKKHYVYNAQRARRTERLSLVEQLDFLGNFIKAVVGLKTEAEAAEFLAALFTENEVKNLYKRLAAARAITAGQTYEQTARSVKLSYATVAKLGRWLSGRTDMVARILARLPEKKEAGRERDFSLWSSFKRSHPLYFWPELVAEGLEQAIQRRLQKGEREALEATLGKLKSRTHHEREAKEEYGKYLRNRPKRPLTP